MNALCSACGKKVPEDRNKCPNCGEWQGEATGKQALKRDPSVLLCDVPTLELDRLQTGPWDECWGTDHETGIKGIVQCSTTLLSGSPGAGKSTLLIQIGNKVAELTGKEVLYLAGEEPLKQIQARARRLSIEWQNRIRMLSLMAGEGNAEDLILQYQPGFLILDSLTSIAGKDQARAVAVAKAIKLFCMKYNIAAIMTCQVTKSGDFAGLEALQHEVDTTMSFFPDDSIEVPKGEEKIRILEVIKNRNGRAFISQHFLMTAKGLQFTQIDEDEEEEAYQDETEEEE